MLLLFLSIVFGIIVQTSYAQLPNAPSYCELAFIVNHLDTCTNGNAVEITILSDERCGPFILDYGDGQIDTLEAGMYYHNYLAAGTYTLTMNFLLYATPPSGPAVRTWTVNTIGYTVLFDHNAVRRCYPAEYYFENQSNCIAPEYSADGKIINFVWDYGDGSPLDTVLNGDHTYYQHHDNTIRTITLRAYVRGTLVGTYSMNINPWAQIDSTFIFFRGIYAMCQDHPMALDTPLYMLCDCDYIYDWSPGIGLSDSTADLPLLLGTDLGEGPLNVYNLMVYGRDSVPLWEDNIMTNITPKLHLTPVNTQQQVFCPGDSRRIKLWQQISGGLLTRKYRWEPATGISDPDSINTIDFTLTAPGDYYRWLHVSSGHCDTSYMMIFTVLPAAPVTPYDFSYQTNCISGDVTFTITGSPLSAANTYEWDFGEGVVRTSNQYGTSMSSMDYSGTRLIKLEVTTPCGQVYTVTKQVEITPSAPFVYNSACCADLYVNYDYTDYTPTAATTWSSPKNIKGTLTIDSGIVMTISNTTISFGMKGKVIIKPGGRLIVNNATLSGITQTSSNSPCLTMWEGIEVWGNGFKKHVPLDQVFQGKLTIDGNSVIRNAHKAIFVGRRNTCYDTPDNPCPRTRGFQDYIPDYGGGIIEVRNTTFIKNAVDIQFAPYVPPSGPGNVSIIESNWFQGGSLADPRYSQSLTAPFPNAGNQYYSPATASGRTYAHIQLRQVKNIRIRDNVFEQADFGINSFNASSQVTQNTAFAGNEFKFLRYGIYAVHAGTGLNHGQTIEGNTFNRISHAAIRVDGGKYTHIRKNSFGDQSLVLAQSNNPKGIYLDNTSYFNITDNFFYRLDTAVQVINSGAEGGTLDSDPLGNLFIQCRKGVMTSLDNFNLQIRCANFENGLETDYSNRNWSIAGLLPNQGATGDHTKPAGNELTPENRKDIYSSSVFTYYRHAQSVDGTQSVTPTIADGSASWGILNTGYAKQNTSCVPPPPCSPHCDLLLQQNQDRQDELAEMYQQIISNLDGRAGTAELLRQINSFGNTSEQLKALLIENSPLSDIVIAALIENHYKLAQQHLMIVCNRNFPVSAELWELVEEILPSLSSGTAEYIRALQLDNPDFPTLTSLERAYLEAINERQGYLEEQAEEDIYAETPEAAATRLLAEEKANQQTAVETYIAQGNVAAAQDAIGSARIEGPADEDWRDLHSMLTELLSGGETIWNMTEQQEGLIRRIATTSDHHDRAVVQAQAILFALYGEEFPMQGQAHPKITARRGLGIKQVQSIATRLMPAYPNPAREMVNVPYYATGENETLILSDLFGRTIHIFKGAKGYNLLTIGTSDYEPGFYLITMKDSGGRLIATQKLLIQK